MNFQGHPVSFIFGWPPVENTQEATRVNSQDIGKVDIPPLEEDENEEEEEDEENAVRDLRTPSDPRNECNQINMHIS